MAGPDLVVRIGANLEALRANLKEGVAQIETTTAHMRSMGNAYDGARIISQAGATVAAIHQIGGASKLTAADMARANAILNEALEKYRVLGQQAPPAMLRLAEETKKVEAATVNSAARVTSFGYSAETTTDKFGRMRDGLSQVDRVLGSLGITIGPQVAALNELSLAAGKSASQLGLIATGGLVLAAAAAGWQIGSMIADMTSLDERFGDNVASMMGWSSSAEGAAAKADVLARASANAGRTITDYAEAIKINNEATRKQQASLIDFEAMLARAKDRVSQLTESEWAQLEASQKVGATTDLLTVKFNMNAAEMAVVRQRLQEKAAAEAEAQQAAEKHRSALEEIKSAGDGWRGTIAGINSAVAEQVKKYLEAGVSQSALATVYNLTATQVKALATAIQEEKKAIEEAERAEEKKAQTSARALAETTKLWNEYNELVVQRTGTTTDIQIAAIERWAADVKLKAQQAGTDTAEFYAAVEALSREKTASVMVDWDALREHSRLSLDETAKKAWATYEAMLARSGEFSIGAIDQFRKTAEEAQKAADMWGTSFGSAMDGINNDVTATTQRIVAAAQTAALTWAEAMTLVAQGKGTMTMTIVGPPRDTTPWGTGPTVPARADGGPVAAGQPYMVGERGPELFIPERSGVIAPSTTHMGATQAGGTTVGPIYITVQGSVTTERQLVDAVSEGLMTKLRSRGFRNPSGA